MFCEKIWGEGWHENVPFTFFLLRFWDFGIFVQPKLSNCGISEGCEFVNFLLNFALDFIELLLKEKFCTPFWIAMTGCWKTACVCDISSFFFLLSSFLLSSISSPSWSTIWYDSLRIKTKYFRKLFRKLFVWVWKLKSEVIFLSRYFRFYDHSNLWSELYIRSNCI